MPGNKRLILIGLMIAAMGCGCASGRPLSLSGSLLSPGRTISSDNVLPRVAVVDFEYAGGEDAVLGRDFDNVRPIMWKGTPGAAIADLVSASLFERGVPVVRVSMAGHVPAGVLVTVRGRIDDFRVSAKRIHSVKVESFASIGLTVSAEGEGVPGGWNSGVISSDVWTSEPFFVTPDGVRESVASAANGVAEEAALRLMTLRSAFAPASGTPAVPGAGGADRPK